LAPAAETCARTTVESNICTSRAVSLNPASMAKKSSKTPALPSRSNRFHTLFHLPNRSGSARQVMLCTVKKCSASRNSLSSRAFAPRAGRQARKTSSAISQSASFIFVDIADPPNQSAIHESRKYPRVNPQNAT
jgi:hypothetical protein